MLMNEVDLTGSVIHTMVYGPLIYVGYMLDRKYLDEHEQELRATSRAIPDTVRCCDIPYHRVRAIQVRVGINDEWMICPHIVIMYLREGYDMPSDLFIEKGINAYLGKFNGYTENEPARSVVSHNIKTSFKRLVETIKEFFVYFKKVDKKIEEDKT